ncbi:MAG: hypothetical protein HC866_25110 [Leptolyngbyaceae cyanobacterium RU_5_1]|nr:hypothetical protein [Leptolyngbyaceae cyanobacterium RU_5_1]
MLHQLTQNKLSRLTLTAGLCLTTVFVNQLDRNVTKPIETSLNRNGLDMNGVALNGTNLNGVSLNDPGLGANGVHSSGFAFTSSTLETAVLQQQPIQQIRVEGGQLALKIKRSDRRRVA